MRLADAIERWGLENRDALDDSQEQSLRDIWSKLRGTNAGMIDIEQLEEREVAHIAAHFARDDRTDVARMLSTVTEWARERSGQPITMRQARGPAVVFTRSPYRRADHERMLRHRDHGLVLAAVSGAVLVVLVVYLLI